MRLVKYTHSCVRLESEGHGVLVIDPGVWSEPDALRGADAVVVTHEHADHVDVLRLAGLGVPVYAPEGVVLPGLDTVGVSAGQEFTAAGYRITAHGGRHATIYGDLPDCTNLGYVVEDRLYHPGDSLHVPAVPVETLLVPLHAPWMRVGDAIEFVRGVGPERAVGIHDAQINERGLASVNGWLEAEARTAYRWLSPGSRL
ncbi:MULTISPECIES: MBL fold metallo-hydrolase [Streptomyces]|uniref:MBL fold metallo-hydrolase n=1 Tax=Streptomyces TaxID=1883 RepID=UPI001679C456|nr:MULTISPECIES: MBL fold metallo-hydrolase [Streptomyces]MBD3575275.1 MBL fold metallo-hydrolase [Streptomyces sp. KD18]GGS91971.1 MBL fold metallo-hydrolase [Streptomyces toxytricini]